MADGISKDDLVEAMAKVFGRDGKNKDNKMAWDPKVAKEFEKSMQDSIEQIKKSTTFGKTFETMLRGQRGAYVDTSEKLNQLNKDIDALQKEYQTSTNQTAKARLIEEQNAKIASRTELEKATAVNRTRVGLQNFAVGIGEVIGGMTAATFSLAKNLQGGGDGLAAAGAFAAASAQQTGKAVSEVGKFMGALGPVIALLAPLLTKIFPQLAKIPKIGPIFAIAGTAIGALGLVAETTGEKIGNLAKETIDYLNKELENTNKAFRSITQSGALLSGGMTEMRQAAATAGLDVTMLSNVVKDSSQNMSQMGIGMGEATKRIAGISGELRKSDLGMQLRNLGYNAEEQASLAASVAANLRAAGDTRVRSDRDVAEMTVRYGKDLKILGDITGQDAKKKMEEARARAMEQDLLAEAMARGGPEAMEKLRNQLATMPDVMKKGYLEFVSSGGEAITDVATNVMLQQNPRLMEQYQTMFATLGDGNKSASDALTETGRLTEQTVAYARDNAAATREIAIAARLAGTQTTEAITSFNNKLIAASTTFGEDVTARAKTSADKLAETIDPLTRNINTINEKMDALRAGIADKLTGAVTSYSNTLARGVETIEQALIRLGFKKEAGEVSGGPKGPGTGEKIGQATGELAGNVAGAAIGGTLGRMATTKIGAAIGTAIMPGVGTAIGAGLGFLAGGLLGTLTGKLGAYIGKKFDDKADDVAVGSVADVPLAADGNVLTGPAKGYLAMLHGTEAVVPLPNGRRIPVDLDLADLTTSINKLSVGVESSGPQAAADSNKETYNKIYQDIQTMTAKTESKSESMMQDQLRMLSEIKDILATSNSLQQQYVYNTYK